MSEEEQPSITFAFEPNPEWPDPIRTHVWEGHDFLGELDAYMAQLEPGQPVVIQTEAEQAVHLTAYTEALTHVSHAGRHLVIQIRET
jgi:hypothetical protein